MQNISPIKPPLPPVLPDAQSEKSIKEQKKNASLLQCPHCQSSFSLTWKRYFKAPTGNHICPNCNGKFSVKRAPLSYIPQGLVGIACGFIIGNLLNKLIDMSFVAVIIGILSAIIISTIIDRIVEPRLGKIIKIDEAVDNNSSA